MSQDTTGIRNRSSASLQTSPCGRRRPRVAVGVAVSTLLTIAIGGSIAVAPPAFAGGGGDEPFKIGYAAALTGDLSPYDSPDGVRCAVERVNEDGGILDREVELIVRDSKSEPTLTTQVGEELLDEGVSVLLGPPTDDATIPLEQVASEDNVAVITVAGTAPGHIGPFGNAYLAGYGDNMAAAAVADYAYNSGLRTAYMLTTRDLGTYGVQLPKWFKESFRHLGGKVIGSTNYSLGLADYGPEVTKIQNLPKKPDMILAPMIVPDIGVFVRQLNAAGVDIPVYGTDGLDDPSWLEIAGDAANGTAFVTHGFPAEGSALKDFYDYCEAKGYDIPNIFFGVAGESVYTIKQAAEKAKSSKPSAINKALKNLKDAPGIVTDTITYKGRKGIPLKNMTIVTVVQGKFSEEKTFIPEFIPKPD